MSDWIENLKAGDDVIVNSNNYLQTKEVFAVTKTQIIIQISELYKARFNKKTKRLIGAGYFNSDLIEEATEQKILLINEREERAKLRRWFKDKKFTFHEMKKIKELIGE